MTRRQHRLDGLEFVMVWTHGTSPDWLLCNAENGAQVIALDGRVSSTSLQAQVLVVACYHRATYSAALCMSSDHHRISRLYQLHFQELVRFLARRLRTPDQAADMIQELFLRLLSRDAPLQAVNHERGFLFGSARNLISEEQRLPRWRGSDADDAQAEDDGDELPSPDEQIEDRRALERLFAALAALPPRCREVFLLHKFDGLSYPAVAARLGISQSAVEKHMMRALQACREAALRDLT
jgi:RNA polymerase sigma-70 factor (ECF subfamily)